MPQKTSHSRDGASQLIHHFPAHQTFISQSNVDTSATKRERGEESSGQVTTQWLVGARVLVMSGELTMFLVIRPAVWWHRVMTDGATTRPTPPPPPLFLHPTTTTTLPPPPPPPLPSPITTSPPPKHISQPQSP